MRGITDDTPSRGWLGPGLAALAAFLLHAAAWDRYGIFRDELYFLVCGERLAFGYVDQPPGIALVARLARGLFGTWVPGLRLLPWLASAATVLLAGRLARALGAGAFGATLASVAALSMPFLLALGHYLTMNAFEPLLATGLALVLVRIALGGDPRLWIAAGALAAGAVLFKYTSALLLLCVLAGMLATPARRLLRNRWAIAGGALALLLVLPNFLWQAFHGFPFAELVAGGQRVKNVTLSSAGFLGSLVLEGGPLAAPVWMGGLAWLLTARAAAPSRFLGAGAAAYLALLLLSGGKPYYLAPALPLLLAAGGAAGETLLRARWARVAVPAALAFQIAVLAPFAVPVLPVESFVAWQAALGATPRRLERKEYGALPQIYADQFGWPELARAVAEVWRALPEDERSRAGIFAQNYGEAAAIDVYGRALGLPPAAAGHNQYFLWGPPAKHDPLLVLGDDDEDCARGAWRSLSLGGRGPDVRWAMPYERNLGIWICRDVARPLDGLWPHVRHYE